MRIIFVQIGQLLSSSFWIKNKYGGCSLTAECKTVALETRVRLPPSALNALEGSQAFSINYLIYSYFLFRLSIFSSILSSLFLISSHISRTISWGGFGLNSAVITLPCFKNSTILLSFSI